ncbi:MAG: hypothetical protein JWQ14_3223 [Adhaeribacter sp.]|nr:hypothetical protein [Adhaeribacter sp.]
MRQNRTLEERKDIVDMVLAQFPKVISPQAHALFDALAFPALAGLTWWMAQKSSRAATLMGLNLGMEGGVSLFTDYPPALVPLVRFENHIRIGMLYAPVSMGLALLTPGIPRHERLILSLLPLIPFLLNGLSKPKI